MDLFDLFSPQPSQPFRFLDLPLEIRRQIYRCTLIYNRGPCYPCYQSRGDITIPTAGGDVITTTRNLPSPPRHYKNELVHFLQTCKQICEEASPIFYSETYFAVMLDDPWRLEPLLKSKQLDQVRRLQVTTRTFVGSAYHIDLDEVEHWIPFLSQLTHLSLVIRSPLLWGVMESRCKPWWNEWVGKWLWFLAVYSDHITVVEVEVGTESDVLHMIRGAFENRLKLVRTLAGDKVFSRTFSLLNHD